MKRSKWNVFDLLRGDRMINVKKSIVSIILMLFALVFLPSPKLTYANENNEKKNTICKGVFIDTVDIGGMTALEAKEALKNHINELRSKSVSIVVGDDKITTTMGELGYTYETKDYIKYIKEAIRFGKSGNLIKRYKDNKDIEYDNKVYPLTYTYDEDKVRNFVELEAKKYEVAPKNASFSRKNGKFVYTDHKLGSKVEVEETVSSIKEILDNWDRNDFEVKVIMKDVEPDFTKESLQKCTSILGEFSTSIRNSTDGRAANVANGARLINNALLYPGEIFSAYSYLLPFTASNGYYEASAYRSGEIIQSIGGGACQVVTTLYNAVLLAEMEVVERYAHSMTVSYVDLAFDAAIAEGAKNFRFRNSSKMPILVEAFCENDKLTFRIWGHETRDLDKRTIKFENKIIKEIEPPSEEKITEDPTKPRYYREITQYPIKGYQAELYKIVYENGVEVSRKKINTSFYHAEPAHVTVGTGDTMGFNFFN